MKEAANVQTIGLKTPIFTQVLIRGRLDRLSDWEITKQDHEMQ